MYAIGMAIYPQVDILPKGIYITGSHKTTIDL